MLRVSDVQLAGTARERVAQIMQPALGVAQPVGAAAAVRAESAAIIAAALDDFGLGQVLDMGDAFAGIGNVLTGPRAGDGSRAGIGLWKSSPHAS